MSENRRIYEKENELDGAQKLIARAGTKAFRNICYEIKYVADRLGREGISPQMWVESMSDEEKVETAQVIKMNARYLRFLSDKLDKEMKFIESTKPKFQSILKTIESDQEEYYKNNRTIYDRGIQEEINDLIDILECVSYSGEDESEDDTIDDLPFM